MNKKWMSILAGILEILAGFWMFASAYYILVLSFIEVPRPWDSPSLDLWLWWMIPFVAVLLGIVSLVGGVCALLRRRWRLALVGAIATIPLVLASTLGVGLWAQFKYNITIEYFIWSPPLLSAAIITIIIRSKREFAL